MNPSNASLWPVLLMALLFAALASAQGVVELAPVVSKPASRVVEIPGEFQPFLSVALHARVQGYVEKVLVDRGSVVKEGQLLAELSAPELKAQIAEAQSKVQAAQSDRVQAEAQAAAAQSTYDRLKQAAQTPGAVATNELIQAEKVADAAKALIASRQQVAHAAEGALHALQDLEAYLKITASFDGVVTDRLVHPGALVGPNSEALLVVQQIPRLRLTVAVPEEASGGIAKGAKVEFKVPAYPGRVFSGTIARISHTLDTKSRTMAVELNVTNGDHALAPGMYATVKWPVKRTTPSLFVPRTAVVTTTERTFVVRDHEGKAQWVDVKKGVSDGDSLEVIGALQPGDRVVKRATDEVRDGSSLRAK